MTIPAGSLLLLRHGQTAWNAERRWQGWSDTPLSPLGEQQARDAAAHLVDAGLTLAVSSDLQRARRTAELVAGGIGLRGNLVVDPSLRERHVGAFEGKTIDELVVDFADCFEVETQRLLHVPDGETDDDLWRRVEPALLALAARYPDDVILVVTHGGVIRTVERRLAIDPGASTPNLGGRWLSVLDGRLVGGDRFLPLDPDLVTAPQTE